MKTQKTLRVGFDLDGVLLYNPTRIVRPLVAWTKSMLLKKDLYTFHYPRTKLQKLAWLILHKSSLFPADGIETIRELARSKKIEAYIVSARYDSLKSDFHYWIRKMKAPESFTGLYHNDSDEQPHLFKERMIEKLKLDVFIEDNWDIIKYLSTNHQSPITNCKIFWIYNLLDRNIDYKYKFPNLKKAIEKVQILLHE